MGYTKEAAKGLGGGAIAIIVIGVVALIIGGLFWGIGVATSGIKGQGDAVKINNSAENWTEKQAFFHEKYNAVKAADQKITLYAATVAANPGDKTAATNLQGITSQCINYVTEYNAESSKFLSRDWKDAELPTTISTTNPSTDCK